METLKTIIRLQDGLMVSDAEKETMVTTERVHLFNSPEHLFESYILPIQTAKGKTNQLLSYNEFGFEKKIKLFLDIDLTIETFLSKRFQERIDAQIKKKTYFESKELNLLSNLIIEFITYFGKKKTFSLSYADQDAIRTLTNDQFKANKNYFMTEILRHVSVTKSTNEKKHSFHVFFNNLIYNKENSKLLKQFIKEFIVQAKNPMAEYIDVQPYKTKPLLRFIYSSKDKDDLSYHYPLSCFADQSTIMIEYDKRELNSDTLTNYLYTYLHPSINLFEIEIYEKNVSGDTFVIKEDAILIDTRDFKKPDQENLTLRQLLSLVFKPTQLTFILHSQGLLNYSDFETGLVRNKLDEILLIFNYEATTCTFCKKNSHKNPHKIFVNECGIVLSKKGRKENCNMFSQPLPLLSEYAICKWVFDKGIIRRLKTNELIFFSEKTGWELLPPTDYSALKAVLLDYIDDYKYSDHATIRNIKEITLKEHFRSLSKTLPPIDLGYHTLFKFRNGVLNLETKEFFPMKESKDLYVLQGVSYDYKSREDYTDEEKELESYLYQVIEQILPSEIKGKPNRHRLVFERNVSTCILTKPKVVITVFQGETSSGKSTIKYLIASTLEKENYLELPISTYTQFALTPNRPNPWLGKVSFKLASFASEPAFKDKINAQTVKLMTEVKIQARILHSNDQEQTNCLSQFIDTNPELQFDSDDPAALRRWAVVRFQTSFKSDKNQNLLSVVEKTSYVSRESLKNEIIEGKYALIFFNILLDWCHKYNQFQDFKMQNTSEYADYSRFLEYFSKCLVNSVLVKNANYIKPSAVHNYRMQLLRFGSSENEFLITETNYISRLLTNVVKNKSWNVNIHQFLQQIEIRLKNKSIFTYVFLDDIKPEFHEEIIRAYALHNKNKQNPEMSLEYYEEHKDATLPPDEPDQPSSSTDFSSFTI